MKRTSVRIDESDGLKRTASSLSMSPNAQIAMPRYGGEVLFQSTSDFQSLNIHLNKVISTDERVHSSTPALKKPPHWMDGTIPFKIFIVILSGCLSRYIKDIAYFDPYFLVNIKYSPYDVNFFRQIISIPFEMIMRLDRGSGMFSAFFLHIYTVVVGLPQAYKGDYILRSKMPVSW